MRGLSRNTGALVAPAIPGYAPAQDERLPFDLDGAKKLLAAGRLSERLLVPDELPERRLRQRGGVLPGGRVDVVARRPEAELSASAPRSQQTPKRVKGEFDVDHASAGPTSR